jgi:hypothetical protein
MKVQGERRNSEEVVKLASAVVALFTAIAGLFLAFSKQSAPIPFVNQSQTIVLTPGPSGKLTDGARGKIQTPKPSQPAQLPWKAVVNQQPNISYEVKVFHSAYLTPAMLTVDEKPAVSFLVAGGNGASSTVFRFPAGTHTLKTNFHGKGPDCEQTLTVPTPEISFDCEVPYQRTND